MSLATETLITFEERKGEVYNPKNSVPTVKHGGGSITLPDTSEYLELRILSRWKES